MLQSEIVIYQSSEKSSEIQVRLEGDSIWLSQKQMDMTLNVMAHSLVYWTRDLLFADLFTQGTKIFAMTSSGSIRVTPYYGAISAAKAALESHVRQLALELAPYSITVNALRAGVTFTPALRKIPGHETMLDFVTQA